MTTETRCSHNFLGFEMPDELIAQYPLEKRDNSRMILGYKTEVAPFTRIVDELEPGDLLVLNDTKVEPTRLTAYKKETLGKVSLLIFECINTDRARCLYKSSHPLKIGQIVLCGHYDLIVVELPAPGQVLLQAYVPIATVMEEFGEIPLPPYLKRESEEIDKERYQSVWAKETGSSAAPTASLHFTPEVIGALRDKGVQISYCTLHVGLGTFLPIHSENIDDHVMHQEWFCVPENTLRAINNTKELGKKVIAVGTTVVRALESVPPGRIDTVQGLTDLFIRPGFQFRFVDRLLTNFHRHDTTLILLVQAFAGKDMIAKSYRKAIEERLRLYSYGDCILLDKELG